MTFPGWNGFTPAFAAEELERLLGESAKAVDEMEKGPLDSFERVCHAVDDATRDLWRTWGALSHLVSVMNSAEWRETEERFQPAIVEFLLKIKQSKVFYLAMKRLLSDDAGEKDPLRRRILRKAVQSAEMSGVALEGKVRERFNDIQRRLAKLSMDFSNAVIDATGKFSYEKNGRTYTIDDASYPETMKHCSDREVRQTLYTARSLRAPENGERISEILRLRAEMAAIMGLANHAELSLASKCAPSVDAVMKMIDDLDVATRAQAEREDSELGGADIEPWDRAYLAERLRERKYSYSEEELKQYFEFSDVLKGLFKISGFLFGIEVRELAGNEKPQVWHDDVRVFSVLEDGEEIAAFYLDPFVRNGLKRGGAWMNEFSDRCDRLGIKPLAVIVLNLPEPDENGRCLMPMREVETLFHEFGHALQCMLTKVGEESAAGINLVEWDAVEVASQFMENWCLDSRTGISVPGQLKEKVVAARKFRAATDCRRQLAFAKTDMLLHIAPVEDPEKLKDSVFRHFGVPVIAGDLFLCSFSHIFAGGYAAGYYGYKWAEVMSADCFGAFDEAGLGDDRAMKALGRRYRDSVLALGGSLDALEVFRKFRGRDPGIEALFKYTISSP